jgi:Spy/CpxP family protein refolding chaperone
MKSMKAIFGILLVFLLGGAVGATATHMYYHERIDRLMHGGHELREEQLVKRLASKLDLDKSQIGPVTAIVRETHAEIEQLRKLHHPQIEAILNKSQVRISQLLRPDQQEKFSRLIAERKQRHK